MSFSEWSTVADIVSAIGVIITLIYLAIQVRQNTRQEEFQGLQSAIRLYLNNIDNATKTEENADIFRKGLNLFDKLSANEQAAFHSKMHSLLHGFHGVWVLYKLGKLPEYELVAMRKVYLEFLLSPGGLEWWNIFKHVPPTHLVEYLDDEIMKAKGLVSPAIEIYPWLSSEGAP